jgi:hypothetical protein
VHRRVNFSENDALAGAAVPCDKRSSLALLYAGSGWRSYDEIRRRFIDENVTPRERPEKAVRRRPATTSRENSCFGPCGGRILDELNASHFVAAEYCGPRRVRPRFWPDTGACFWGLGLMEGMFGVFNDLFVWPDDDEPR